MIFDLTLKVKIKILKSQKFNGSKEVQRQIESKRKTEE